MRIHIYDHRCRCVNCQNEEVRVQRGITESSNKRSQYPFMAGSIGCVTTITKEQAEEERFILEAKNR